MELTLKDEENYNVEVHMSNQSVFRVFADTLHNQGLDSWKDWICYAGAHRIYVDKNLDVFGGMCCNDKLGSLVLDFELLDHTVCKKTFCTGCTDDLAVKKYHTEQNV